MTRVLDDLLDEAVLEGALAAGRDPLLAARQFGVARVMAASSSVAESAATREHRSPFGDQWSDEENAKLREWAGVLGDEEIAARLGRTRYAVKVRRFRRGLSGPTVHPDYLTAQGVAKALGVDVHAVCRWIEMGMLAAELAPLADRKVWRVRRSVFYAWALRPENWVYFIRAFRDGRIRDERLARLMAHRAETWGDEWWSTGQVAEYHGVDHKDVARYIHAGKLPGVRWSNWWVLRSEATRPGLRFYKGKGSTTFDQSGTPDGDAFLVLAVAVGIPWEHVRRMARMGKGAPQSRHAAIVERGLLPALIRAYELPVRYRKSDGATWCDWRMVAHRFPVVARAWERFHAGRPMTKLELYALAGVMRSAVVWIRGADDPLARRLSGHGLPGREHLAAGVAVYQELAAVGGHVTL